MKLTSARDADGPAVRPPDAPPLRWRYKRPFDLAVLGLVGVALWPAWLLLVAAIVAAVRLQDGGPALYRQRRLGLGGQPFDRLKFRPVAYDCGTDRDATPSRDSAHALATRTQSGNSSTQGIDPGRNAMHRTHIRNPLGALTPDRPGCNRSRSS